MPRNMLDEVVEGRLDPQSSLAADLEACHPIAGEALMRILKGVLSIFPALLLAVVASSCAGKQGGESLDQAVSSFVKFRVANDYKGIWKSSSHGFKAANDNDEVAYEEYVRSHHFHAEKVDVLNLSESGAKGMARVRVHYVEDGGGDIGSAVEEWSFISIGDVWYFDGTRTISESANQPATATDNAARPYWRSTPSPRVKSAVFGDAASGWASIWLATL